MHFINTRVFNVAGAVYGARNAMSSWDKSDSDIACDILGENDLSLASKLVAVGSEHRKFMRQIFVTTTIIAPQYFMAELDTYKVGVTRNSTSFMHTGLKKRFEIRDFDIDKDILFTEIYDDKGEIIDEKTIEDPIKRQMYDCSILVGYLVNTLNKLRDLYLKTKDDKYFRMIRQLLPQSYLYRSTLSMNYENIFNMIKQRKNHRLTEWNTDFMNWARSLPYANVLLGV